MPFKQAGVMLAAKFHLRCTFIRSDKVTLHSKSFQISINELQENIKLEPFVAGPHYKPDLPAKYTD